MLLKGVLFLPTDTWDHIDALAVAMSRQKQRQISRSDAVQWLVLQHWKKTQIKKVKKMADEKKLVIAA